MKPEKKLLKDLNDKTGPNTIKVKAISKSYVQTSPPNAVGKSVKYKRIVFEDEEGSQIKTTLYNDDIDAYEEVIHEQVEYEISGARVKPLSDKHRSTPQDHMFQLSFNNKTTIKPVDGAPRPSAPKYQTINFTTKTSSSSEDFGFSLTTTTATVIIIEPEGELADELRKWKEEHKEQLLAKQKQILEVRLPQTTRMITTFDMLRNKKAANTLQEERHWLKVTFPEFDCKDVRFYLGCSSCSTRSNEDVDVMYTCEACNRENMMSIPKLNVSFEATDGTGSYSFTAFTEVAEKLLAMKTRTLFEMTYEDQAEYLSNKELELKNTPIFIQVGPSGQLSRSRILKWVLKTLSIE